MFDVIVVGAGPIGSLTAMQLSQKGRRVLLLEEHAVVGEPRHCTGILGREAYERFPYLPKTPIQSELQSAWIVSPSGERTRASWYEGQAFIIHRAQFDRAMADMATQAGTELRTGCRATRIDVQPDFVRIEASDVNSSRQETLEARSVVLASGVSYRLHQQLGLKPPAEFLYCAQSEVSSRLIAEVEVYIGQSVAPGSFAWAVPLGNGRVRVGVTAHHRATESLEKLLGRLKADGRIDSDDTVIVKRPVPIQPIACSVTDRVLLAGDAAGQVKPTTGGGIYYGLVGAEMAAQTLEEGLTVGRLDKAFLMAYDRRWKASLGREMFLARMGRKLFEMLPDERLDRLVRICDQENVKRLIEPKASFDWHARNIMSLISSPRVLWQLL